jgi:predicted AAA+ superfamily ATPase
MPYDNLMDIRFLVHNTHLEDPEQFSLLDPHLRRLKSQRYCHYSYLLDGLPLTIPGIYTLGGGRQIGKTTLLKQWIQKQIQSGVNPATIAFFSGELIDDHHALLRLIQTQLSEMPEGSLNFILIDEITYIKDWDKAIKYASDSGMLEDVILLLTGSDLVLIEEARMRFPGRRGKASVVNFHLYPLSFRETIQLKHGTMLYPPIELLFDEFQNYLMHGGYLTAINDLALEGRILESTLMTYSDWIRGDMVKRGKQEHYLREILQAIVKRYGSQITWNALAHDLSIDHPKTVADYVALLESMDAVFVQPALLEDKLVGAPKKARKVMFTDPFIFHAISAWLTPVKNPFVNQIQPLLKNSKECSVLVESCAVTHYRRLYPTYYIKAEGEVDIAYIKNNRFWPIEIKWAEQLGEKDLKQILKYKNGLLLTKNKASGSLQHLLTEPLPFALWNMFNQ